MKIIGRTSKIAWPHLIVDDSYSKPYSNWLTTVFEQGKRKVLNKFSDQLNEDESFKPGVNRLYNNGKMVNHISYYVPYPEHCSSRWAKIIDDMFCQSYDINNISTTEYISHCYGSFLQLNIIPPGFKYGWHLDATYKLVSGVTYWDPHNKGGNGTILKSGKNQVEIDWKHNRSIWFSRSKPGLEYNDPLISKELLDRVYTDSDYPFYENCNKNLSWHKYTNTTNRFRYSINMFVISQQNMMGLMGNNDELPFDNKSHVQKTPFGEWLIWNIPDQYKEHK